MHSPRPRLPIPPTEPLLVAACDSTVDITMNINAPAAPAGACGDGQLDPGEECDDGVGDAPDGACRLNCTLNVCGDGDIGPDEVCDDGAQNDDDGACKLDCTPAVLRRQEPEQPRARARRHGSLCGGTCAEPAGLRPDRGRHDRSSRRR